MVNFKILFKILGSLLFIEAALMLSCLAVALYYKEDDIMAFSTSVLFTACAGLILKYIGRDASNSMSRKDAYLIVTSTWIVFSLFGMLPFLISGYLPNIADAYFETMSGFTTTGATIIDDVEIFPHGLLFWRSLTHLIGGLGIVFFTIAVLPTLVGGNIKVFAAESTGPIKSKLHPRLTTNAKWIWTTYIVLTAACVISFWLAGMSVFDSLNYAMATTATGGFSTHNDSVVFFHSSTIEYLAILFQFLAGVNFTLLYIAIFKFKFRSIFKDSEFRLYISVILVATSAIMYLLITRRGYELMDALRCSLFTVVSFLTSTGLFNDDAGKWPHLTWVILAICMFIGGCAGSTSGGFKCIRSVMVLKVLRNEFRHILHPNAVLPVKINDNTVPQSYITTLLTFFILFVLICLLAAMIMIGIGIDNTNAITIALSCMSNVGPTLGTEIGPVMSWSQLPDYIKWICSLLMLMGRLEIMTVLVLFTPLYWREN